VTATTERTLTAYRVTVAVYHLTIKAMYVTCTTSNAEALANAQGGICLLAVQPYTLHQGEPIWPS